MCLAGDLGTVIAPKDGARCVGWHATRSLLEQWHAVRAVDPELDAELVADPEQTLGEPTPRSAGTPGERTWTG